MRDKFDRSSTPCSSFLKHAKPTSKEREATQEARLSCVWWTKEFKVSIAAGEGSEGSHQETIPRSWLRPRTISTCHVEETRGWDPCGSCRSRYAIPRQYAQSMLKTGRTVSPQ